MKYSDRFGFNPLIKPVSYETALFDIICDIRLKYSDSFSLITEHTSSFSLMSANEGLRKK